MKKYLIILCVTLVGFASCMKDKGSYDYHSINQIVIENIDDKSEVLQFSEPNIVPVIKQTFQQNESNLRFLWTIENDLGQIKDTLSRHRNLDEKVSLVPDVYSVGYYVTDKNTGVFTKKTLRLEVKSALGDGLLVLSELDSRANLTYIYNNKLLQDIELTIPGGIGSNPQKVNYHAKSKDTPAYVSVMCSDDKGGVILNSVTLTKEMDYSEFFEVRPSKIAPQGYINSRYGYKYSTGNISDYYGDMNYEFICNDGKIHERFRSGCRYKMNAPYISSDEKGYSASPEMFSYNGYNTFYIFDRKNHRFLQKSYNSANKLEPVETQNGYNVVDPNAVAENLELVKCDIGYTNSSSVVYCLIFTDGSAFYCMQAMISRWNLLIPYYEPMNLNYDKTIQFAPNTISPSVYYSVKNEIYNFDTESKTSVLRHTFPQGEVTCLKAEPYVVRNEKGVLTFDHMRLYVGLKSDAVNGRTGSVYIYKIANDNTLVEIARYEHIAGEIKSFAWKI